MTNFSKALGFVVLAASSFTSIVVASDSETEYQPATVEENVLVVLQKCQKTWPSTGIYYDQENGKVREFLEPIEAPKIVLRRLETDPAVTRTQPLNVRTTSLARLGLGNLDSHLCIYSEVAKIYPEISCKMKEAFRPSEESAALMSLIPVRDLYGWIDLWVNNKNEFHSAVHCLQPR